MRRKQDRKGEGAGKEIGDISVGKCVWVKGNVYSETETQSQTTFFNHVFK